MVRENLETEGSDFRELVPRIPGILLLMGDCYFRGILA